MGVVQTLARIFLGNYEIDYKEYTSLLVYTKREGGCKEQSDNQV